MDILSLHPTPTAEWKALVEEAKLKNSYSLTEDMESYLVFLLMRFVENPEIAYRIMAMDFLKSFDQLKTERSISLRNIGDTCLLFAGLFPGRAERRRVRISYFVRLGQMAYSSLSEERKNHLTQLFADLAEHFVVLMDIMHCMRELNEQGAGLDLKQAEELWNDTKSLHSLNLLKKATPDYIPKNLFPINIQKH